MQILFKSHLVRADSITIDACKLIVNFIENITSHRMSERQCDKSERQRERECLWPWFQTDSIRCQAAVRPGASLPGAPTPSRPLD